MGKVNNQKGMTLIEVLASITISMFILGVVLALFHTIDLYLTKNVENKDQSFDSTELFLHFSNSLSSPREILYQSANQLTYQGTEGNFYKLSAEDERIKIVKCQSCGSIMTFEEDSILFEDKMDGQVQFLDQSGNPLQSSNNLINETIKIVITYPIKTTTPTGQEKVKYDTKTWVVTPFP